MDRHIAEAIFARYRSGECTESERRLVEDWVMYGEHGHLDLTDSQLLEDMAAIRSELERQLRPEGQESNRFRRWLPYAAAIVLIATLFGVLTVRNGEKPETRNITHTEISPGGNRAMLSLADGRTVDLSEQQSGIIMGDDIRYADGSAVLSREAGDDGRPEYATLITPKGGTYNILLPDGSRVWLNAASKLKYPTRFTGEQRVVELEGEAYFEVVPLAASSGRRSEKQPFIVRTKSQRVEVLGTRFNISAYGDENEVKTTLVEGGVRVHVPETPGSMLKPGQQSVVQKGSISVREVDVTAYVAWKNGNFYFNNTPLSEMMNQIARWYDVEVIYERDMPRESFSGTMSRKVSLQTVLELLKISEIDYRLEGRTLIIE